MNSCNSCQEHFSVGCFGHCDNIVTGFLSTEGGTHIVRAWFNGDVFDTDLEINEPGVAITIPGGTFNEDFTTFFEIIMPSGDSYIHSVDGTDYTCFKAVTVVKF